MYIHHNVHIDQGRSQGGPRGPLPYRMLLLAEIC